MVGRTLILKNKIDLTVITPSYNEEGGITKCIEDLRSTLNQYSKSLNYEHIIIDNNSTDNTAKIVAVLARQDPRIKLVVNSRNIGASRSIFRALGMAKGEWVVPMLPADLQDPVSVIPQFLDNAKLGEVDVVYGIRKNRQESFLLRTMREIYYRAVRKFSNIEMQLNAGEFALINKKVANAIVSTNDQYPYVRGLIAQTNSRFSKVEYSWDTRKTGKSKANPLELIDVAINGFVSTSQVPARLALLSGFVLSSFGIVAGLGYLVATLIFSSQVGTGIPTLVVAFFFITGIQLFFLGLIGEYVLSIHRQIRPEPPVYNKIEVNL